LRKHYGKENIEKRFGGLIPDKTSNYFPPDFSAKVLKPKETETSKLINTEL